MGEKGDYHFLKEPAAISSSETSNVCYTLPWEGYGGLKDHGKDDIISEITGWKALYQKLRK